MRALLLTAPRADSLSLRFRHAASPSMLRAFDTAVSPTPPQTRTPVLDVRALTTRFATPEGEVLAADGVGFTIGPGEALGVVGESGSGKTQVFLSIMGLLARNGRSDGSVLYRSREILNL